MNSLLEEELPGNFDLRDELLEIISDKDLAYKLPGSNPTLGDLCIEMGQVQQVYAHSFRAFTHDWSNHASVPEKPASVAGLKNWYKQLDEQLIAALSELSEADIHDKEIDRGDFSPSPYVQFQIYREAILIFYAKASVYLKALEIRCSEEWKRWVG